MERLPPGFHDQPVLVVDPGRHTSRLWRADVDAAGRLAVTASDDKTVRIWSLADGSLICSIRLPAGPGDTGKARAVAIDPAGEVIAAGGWTTPPGAPKVIYVYGDAAGAPLHRDGARPDIVLLHRIGGLPDVVNHLTFSPDGRRLAATMEKGGLRVFDRDRGWAETARDEDYDGWAFGAAFAPDGGLAAAAFDGFVRLYGPDLSLRAKVRAPGGDRPFDVAFDPHGARLAVGYFDSARVDVLDGRDLAPLHAAATEGVDNGNLSRVAWAADGTLLAGGRYVVIGPGTVTVPVLTWEAEGRGARRDLPVGSDTVNALRPLPGGDLLVAASGTTLARLTSEGRAAWSLSPVLANFIAQHETLAISADGGVVDFQYTHPLWGGGLARFDVTQLSLAEWPWSRSPVAAGSTAPPQQRGLPIEGWLETMQPTLGGQSLPLAPFELSRSLALHPDGHRFVLGTEWSLRAFDAEGTSRWRQPAPGAALAVNISGDGRLAVAAYSDGTLRWHDMDDGRELLAFMPLSDRINWVVWTPEGFYAASPGAHGVLRWHVNQDWGPAKGNAVADIPGFHRPEAIRLVLREMQTPRAVGLAVVDEQRRRVQLATDRRVPQGAKLHVVAVGISEYDSPDVDDLRFAHQDAHDVFTALTGTQDGLYAAGHQVNPQDQDATGELILGALENVQAGTTPGDLAVFHFAGHGKMDDGTLYLLPHDARVGSSAALRLSALPIPVVRREITKITERGGRVLVLLDTCYSGGASHDGQVGNVASAALSTALAAANITVLTSSSASEKSREDSAWQNGAFTEAVLEALGPDADADHDGLISATELAAYVDRRVRNLTGGAQSPAMELRFDGTLFAVGSHRARGSDTAMPPAVDGS